MNFNEFKDKYRLRLTEAQSEACRTAEGYTLLLAVPGSGKTTVLISRLGYMIYALGIDPRSILTMTYTVAATHDMRERFCSVFGEELRESLEFRTINGVCAKIIGSYESMKGSKAFSLVTDEKELSAAVSAIYRECTGEYATESDTRNIRAKITYAKNMMLSAEETAGLDEDGLPFSQIYEKYNSMLREQRLMDYDDQMIYAYRILKTYPAILSRVSARYRYICVDEAQDTSKIQHAIISLIAHANGNLFMVGDEDQSIYGFRAAYPEALLRFEAEHEGAKVLKIEKNFRSATSIVAAADGFIAKNTLRHQKSMLPSREDAGELSEISLRGKIEQYQHILLKVARNCRENTAVLYRNNESALPFIDILEKYNIPYRIKALDTAFFTCRTVQDITNIIRFANNTCDTEAFMQIYYKINTHLSKAAATAACEYCKREGMNVLDAVWEVGKIGAGTLKSCKAMKRHFMSLVTECGDKAIFRIVNYMGYGEYMDRMGTSRGKAEILEAIGASEPTAKSLLFRLSELHDIVKEHRAPEGCRFTLSTIHSAKGLEYDTVYLADVCDGVFPEIIVKDRKNAPKEELEAYEEERRLFYVGATRAKNKLFLFTYSGRRSQFCDELLGKKEAAAKAYEPSKKMTLGDIAEFRKHVTLGEQINHSTFGKGTVVFIDGDIITVRFAGSERKLSVQTLFEKNLLIN